MAYQPRQGDIIYLNFDPQAGHEQAGRRPGLVVSNDIFHKYTNGFGLVCPITNTQAPFPMHVHLDANTKTTGVVMCEQVKSLDLIARQASFVERIPEDLLADTLQQLHLSLN